MDTYWAALLIAGEDTNFNDIPSLVKHKQRLKDKGQDGEGSLVSETAKAQFFAKNIWDDIKDNARNATDKALGFGSMITEKASEIIGVGTGGLGGTSRHRSSSRVSVDSVKGCPTDRHCVSKALLLHSGGRGRKRHQENGCGESYADDGVALQGPVFPAGN